MISAWVEGKNHEGAMVTIDERKKLSLAAPFIAAVELSEESHPMFIKFNKVTSFTEKEITAWISKNLVQNSYVISEGLNCFPGVMDGNCSHFAIPCNRLKDESREVFKWINTLISNIKTAIHGAYHALPPTNTYHATISSRILLPV
ncbi:MAG: transposase [Desulfotalea sp.]